MRKPHLFTSEEPWHAWDVQLQADCGREVPSATCMAMADTYEPVWLSGIRLCKKCLKAQKSARYLYVIREGNPDIDETFAD